MTSSDVLSELGVYQDGREFYNEATGGLVFRASMQVRDFDLVAAEAARTEFLGWIRAFLRTASQ